MTKHRIRILSSASEKTDSFLSRAIFHKRKPLEFPQKVSAVIIEFGCLLKAQNLRFLTQEPWRCNRRWHGRKADYGEEPVWQTRWRVEQDRRPEQPERDW